MLSSMWAMRWHRQCSYSCQGALCSGWVTCISHLHHRWPSEGCLRLRLVHRWRIRWPSCLYHRVRLYAVTSTPGWARAHLMLMICSCGGYVPTRLSALVPTGSLVHARCRAYMCSVGQSTPCLCLLHLTGMGPGLVLTMFCVVIPQCRLVMTAPP